VRDSGAYLLEGVVEHVADANCAGARFQYTDFGGIERSTCPRWAVIRQSDSR